MAYVQFEYQPERSVRPLLSCRQGLQVDTLRPCCGLHDFYGGQQGAHVAAQVPGGMPTPGVSTPTPPNNPTMSATMTI